MSFIDHFPVVVSIKDMRADYHSDELCCSGNRFNSDDKSLGTVEFFGTGFTGELCYHVVYTWNKKSVTKITFDQDGNQQSTKIAYK